MGEQPDRIENIESFEKLRSDIHGMKQVKRVVPHLRGFLARIGVDVDDVESVLSQVDTIANDLASLATLPDRFNRIFADRGWIMYEMMNVEVAQAATNRAETGDIDGAEQILVDYYDEAMIKIHITWMAAVEAFRPRVPLARKALEDYVAERYHASVPVVLALLDGMVNDLGPRGFFAEGVNLEAWDSIAAHSTGLLELSRVLGKSRQKTTTEQIHIPYRHGILHGMDLGYESKIVAAKAWAALFATRDWALKVEKGQINKPPPAPKKGWVDTLRQIKENTDDKAWLNAWSPRAIEIGKDIPVNGKPEDFKDGTPEQKLAEFLFNWSNRNYGRMAQCFSVEERVHINRTAGRLRAHYDAKRLKAFELLTLEDYAAAVSIVTVKVLHEQDGSEIENCLDFRLINEDSKGRPTTRGKPGSGWSIYTMYL